MLQGRDGAECSYEREGVYASANMGDSALGYTGSVDAGIAIFEMKYGHWVDEQNRHTAELRSALQQGTDLELHMLVETGLSNYEHLFSIKSIATNSDMLYVMSGMWKTPVERLFLWIGGFRPSEVLKMLSPQLEPLTEQQGMAVCNLRQNLMQAEDALSRGMEKLQQTLAETLTSADSFGSNYMLQMASAVEMLIELSSFVNQADHLRHTVLQQMDKILTTRQAARGLLALSVYFQLLRMRSQQWEARPLEAISAWTELQGVCASGNMGDSALGYTGSVDAGINAFEMKYGLWVDEQNRHTAELRSALQQGTELELRMLVETGLNNNEHFFMIKSIVANSDMLYVMSGIWKTPVKRFFLWIGGFRAVEILKILSLQLEPLTEQQVMAVCNLKQVSTQADDALSQGMEKLQQILAESLTATDPFGSYNAYMLHVANAMEKLKALASFVDQADQIRYTTLQHMHKILTMRQAARGLLALGDYFHRLRALNQVWAARPCKSEIS